MNNWYNYVWNEVVERLESSSIYGLSSSKIEESREKNGDNKFTGYDIKAYVSKFIKKYLFQPWTLLTFIIGAFLILNHFIFSGIVFLILFFSNFIIVLIESSGKIKKIKTLKRLNDINALVLREGKVINIPSDSLVVGDIVYIEKGSVIPADMRIIDSSDLKINEAPITGVNCSVEKYETKIEEKDLSIGELTNMAFRSSVVTQGSGTGIVVTVGIKTEIGRIIKNIKNKNDINMNYLFLLSPIINKFIIIACLAIVILELYNIFFYKHFAEVFTVFNFLCFAPYIIILCLWTGFLLLKKHFNKEGIYFNDLNSLKTFSEVDTFCMGKIGAFSVEDTYVKEIYAYDEFANVNEDKYELNDNFEKVITISLLSSKCMFDASKDYYKGEIADIALVKFGLKNNIDKHVLEGAQRKVYDLPFDFSRKTSVSLNKFEKNYRVNIKGPVEKVLERCTYIMKDGVEREITADDILKIKEADIEMCSKLLQTAAVAYRNYNYKPSKDENIESYLVFAGIIGFENPLKDENIDCIKDFNTNGIKPVIFTDDNKLTAQYFSKHIGFPENDAFVLCGVELDNIPDEEVKISMKKADVFSKISSEQKIKVIETLNEEGCKVCAVGNKFCDLSYMEIAASEIAAGENCSFTTRNLSDIFMKDYNYKSLTNIKDKFKNILMAFKTARDYIISCSALLMIYNFIYYMFFLKFAFSMIQTLCIDILCVSVCSILLIVNYEYVYEFDKKFAVKYIFFSIAAAFIGYMTRLFLNIRCSIGIDYIIIYIMCVLFSMCFIKNIKCIFKSSLIINILNIIILIAVFLIIK